MNWKSITLGILLVVFFTLLYKAYCKDLDDEKQRKIPSDIHDVVSNIVEKNQEKRYKKILYAARDQIIRGLLIGLTEGSLLGSLQSGTIVSLANGIVSGFSTLKLL